MAQYVQRAKQLGMPLLIELKVTGHEQGDFVTAMIQELDGLDALEPNAFHSLDPMVIKRLESARPQLRTGLTLAMHRGPLPELPCDFYVVEQGSITADMVTATHRTGKQILAWTINDHAAMTDLVRMEIDGLITDRVELATRLTSQ
jgi:glycerophosphoryl diester phosphodiesterase